MTDIELLELRKKNNLDWWRNGGIVSDSVEKRMPHWDDFVRRANIDIEKPYITVGEISCGAFGGIVNNYYINCESKVLIDPYIMDFKEQGWLVTDDKTQLVASYGENIMLDDNDIDLLIGYNSIDHADNPTKAISECVRVAKECVLAFDCRSTPGYTMMPNDMFHTALDYNFVSGFCLLLEETQNVKVDLSYFMKKEFPTAILKAKKKTCE